MIYPRLKQSEMAKALDIKGRNKAVAANLMPLGVIVYFVGYCIVTAEVKADTILLAVGLFLVALCLGVKLQSDAVIESVYRCKEAKNKAVYQKHKIYFDKQFKRRKFRPSVKTDRKGGGD